MAQFKNLIFDIGDVIVDIDYLVILAEFKKIATIDFQEIVSYSHQHKVFDLFETGKISAPQFREELRWFLKEGTADDAINYAWNAILVGYSEEKLNLLLTLKTRYKTFALSNINELHAAEIDEAVQVKFGAPDFKSFFHKAYYSYEVGYRKPEKEIYELLLQQENLKAEETFFVDDKEENVSMAKNVGIQAYQLTDRNKLFELLEDLKII